VQVEGKGVRLLLLCCDGARAAQRVGEQGCQVVHDLVHGTRDDRARFLHMSDTQSARAEGLQVLLLESRMD
jgi:hypothetical protein